MSGYIVIVKGLSNDPCPHSATKSASSSRSSWGRFFFFKCRGNRRLRYGGKRIEPEQVRFPKLAVDYNIGWYGSIRSFWKVIDSPPRRKTPVDASTGIRIRVWLWNTLSLETELGFMYVRCSSRCKFCWEEHPIKPTALGCSHTRIYLIIITYDSSFMVNCFWRLSVCPPNV